MDRGCGNEILATDASPEFGFGVSRANCSRECARHLCGLAEKRGDYVRLFLAPGDPPVVDRLGIPQSLDLSLHDFTDVLSHKAKWQAHSSVLEAHGLLLGIRWAVRAARSHHSRLPVLVDAKAVLGAASKGRSSSSALRGSLRALAANVLAADILLRLIYVPSECMPADAASRGKRACASQAQASEVINIVESRLALLNSFGTPVGASLPIVCIAELLAVCTYVVSQRGLRSKWAPSHRLEAAHHTTHPASLASSVASPRCGLLCRCMAFCYYNTSSATLVPPPVAVGGELHSRQSAKSLTAAHHRSLENTATHTSSYSSH